MQIPPSERLTFSRFSATDVSSLADLLADSSITRNITANGSNREHCLGYAAKRIEWHNSTWSDYGYGVWALTARNSTLAPAQRLLGWCGFVPPDGDAQDPEILYAIRGDYRGIGLASEAAKHAISHLFETTDYRGVTAVISTQLNPGSVKVVTKLGLSYRERMDFVMFLSDTQLADDVAEYEIWRLGEAPADHLESLVEQTSFRAGQLSTVTSLPPKQILSSLIQSLLHRQLEADFEHQLQVAITETFDNGRNNAYMDCYHVTRQRWAG